jgi:hypothetical protein
MTMRRVVWGIGAAAAMLAVACARAEDVAGKVSEVGFGKLKVTDSSGADRVVLLSQKSTTYEPETWRPAVGDRVKIECTLGQGRSGPTLIAQKAVLKDAGPNTMTETGPLVVTVTEVGRAGAFKAKTPKDREVRFEPAKATKWEPVGWQLKAGDRARVTFHVQPVRIGYGLVYVADEIEQVR